MYTNIFKKLAVVATALLSFNSSASLITANGSMVGTLDLNGVAASFVDFYDLSSSMPNTGFEQPNEVVMFVAELSGEYALFTTISGAGSTRGKLEAEFTPNDGSFLLFDEPFELSGTSAAWKTGIGKGDGFIFGSDAGLLDIAIDFSYVLDISAYTFLTFDSFGVASTLLSGSIDSAGPAQISVAAVASSNAISEPNLLALMGFGLLGFVARRQVKK